MYFQVNFVHMNWIKVPGGAKAREIALCGFEPSTTAHFHIQASSTYDDDNRTVLSGNSHFSRDISTLGECSYYNNTMYIEKTKD